MNATIPTSRNPSFGSGVVPPSEAAGPGDPGLHIAVALEDFPLRPSDTKPPRLGRLLLLAAMIAAHGAIFYGAYLIASGKVIITTPEALERARAEGAAAPKGGQNLPG